SAPDLVEHLRGAGLHSCPGTCGQDDHGGGGGVLSVSHVCGSSGSTGGLCRTAAGAVSVPPSGLEPETSEPKSEVLPITPWRIAPVAGTLRTGTRRCRARRGAAGAARSYRQRGPARTGSAPVGRTPHARAATVRRRDPPWGGVGDSEPWWRTRGPAAGRPA